MDVNALREILKQQPFRPFMLRMNDGREFFVRHPEWLMVDRSNVIFIDMQETMIHLEPLLIASAIIRKTGGPTTSVKEEK